jgi:hypothetical protein
MLSKSGDPSLAGCFPLGGFPELPQGFCPGFLPPVPLFPHGLLLSGILSPFLFYPNVMAVLPNFKINL